MAVPKKRTSKAKTRARKACWKRQAFYQSIKAISLAKSFSTMSSKSFIYAPKDSGA